MFKENDLIRRITEDGTGEIVRVLEDVVDEYSSVHVAVGNDDSEDWFDPSDYELVTDDQEIHMDLKPMQDNVPQITHEQVHEEICKLFATVTQWMRANEVDEQIELAINATHYKGDDIDVSFNARIQHEYTITSDNLFESAKVALKRKREDDLLKPLTIPFYKDATE